MKVFLRRVSPDSTLDDLYKFVAAAVGPRWYAPFRADGQISDCELLNISTRRGKWLETHCVVDIEPAEVAERAILRLNGRKLRGEVVEVRRWHERAEGNDRRDAGNTAELQGDEQRRSDRRRAGLNLQFMPAG
jgi:hypothetical protein